MAILSYLEIFSGLQTTFEESLVIFWQSGRKSYEIRLKLCYVLWESYLIKENGMLRLLEIRNFFSLVEKYFTRSLCSLVKYLKDLKIVSQYSHVIFYIIMPYWKLMYSDNFEIWIKNIEFTGVLLVGSSLLLKVIPIFFLNYIV